jgi:transcriptional regulator with XRE-family HTH domain
MNAVETPRTASDEDRRAELKHFLMQCRSRLTPRDVGLPATSRRRVAGLRREEIAELVGVSSDWYRWFESGRPIRVSLEFVSRVADALRLEGDERATLLTLALPEVAAAIVPSLQRSSTDFLDSVSSLRKAVRRVLSASSVVEILTTVTEAVAERFEDAEQFGVYQRIEPGRWDYPVVLENGRLPSRVADLHIRLRDGFTPAQVDESMLHMARTSPGAAGTWRELLRSSRIKQHVVSALEAEGFKDADCLNSRIKSGDGFEVTLFVSYMNHRKMFSEFDRTLLGTLGDVASLAMRSCTGGRVTQRDEDTLRIVS